VCGHVVQLLVHQRNLRLRVRPASHTVAEMITIRLDIRRIVSLQPDTDIQKRLSNGNRIRISETLFSIFRGFRFLEKVAYCVIISLL